GNYTVHFNCTGDAVFMDAKKELILFRIVQEALNNVIKHAQATEITVNMHYGAEELSIQVADNGQGMENPSPLVTSINGGSGLGNMKKRAAMVGGRCTITAQPGGGVCVTVTVAVVG
ncbi:MAG: ATP-binding protein, partial [Dinghuibacter sp.]|nr:ATP-binding protein [Dinghuibacter sp.]